jgi:hypothetical protein
MPAPIESEYEAILRQQQLAAAEQLAQQPPTIQPSYDPEELFVELSRLPSNLIEPKACRQFLFPIVPIEIRLAYGNGLHVHSLVYFATKADANSVIQRDGEAGIKIRESPQINVHTSLIQAGLIANPSTPSNPLPMKSLA